MLRLLPQIKILVILFLTFLMLLPMGHIRSLIRERQALRDQVIEDVARSNARAQTVTGPVLIVPYTRTVREEQFGRDRNPVIVTRETSGELRLLPASLNVDGALATEERARGIYKARIFRAGTQITGEFEIPAYYGIAEDAQSYRFGAAHLALGVSDIRGIENALVLKSNGTEVPFQPGTGTVLLASGVQAPLPVDAAAESQRLSYDIALTLTGTGTFNVTPLGRETNVRLKSGWPHPAFTGEFLPRDRNISSDGFDAKWQTSFFSTNLEEILARCPVGAAEECGSLHGRDFGVSFVDPVDQYLKSERAAKYAFLFIGLTFAGFFLTEVLRRVSVHPVQYGLVGLALAMFFLLLLSFSEHIGFAAAYAVSAAACVGLITFYVAHVLASAGQGLGFGAALASVYGLLYGILSSEDYALLMGSLLVFGLLAAVMVLTRRVAWNNLGGAR
jgi:inner membrane protein